MRDDVFARGAKVPMTKEEVRLLALERLDLAGAGLLLDVGAGTGSVAIEAALRHPELKVVALEKNPEALSLIRENADRLGCSDRLQILAGAAPCALDSRPDAVFIGGSGGRLTAIIDWALALLAPGGRLVMSFILLDNLTSALAHLQGLGVAELSCSQLQVSQLQTLGSGFFFKPNNPVFLLSCIAQATKEVAHVLPV